MRLGVLVLLIAVSSKYYHQSIFYPSLPGSQYQYAIDGRFAIQPQLELIIAHKLEIQIKSFKILSYRISYSLFDIDNYEVRLQRVDTKEQVPFVVNIRTKRYEQPKKVINFMSLSVPISHHAPTAATSIVQNQIVGSIRPNIEQQVGSSNVAIFPVDISQNTGQNQNQQLVKYVKNIIRKQYDDDILSSQFNKYKVAEDNPQLKSLFIYPYRSLFFRILENKYGDSMQVVARKQLSKSDIEPLISQIETQQSRYKFTSIKFNNRYVIEQDGQSQTVDLLILSFKTDSGGHKLYEAIVYGKGNIVNNENFLEKVNNTDRYYKGKNYLYKQITDRGTRRSVNSSYKYQQKKEKEIMESVKQKLDKTLEI